MQILKNLLYLISLTISLKSGIMGEVCTKICLFLIKLKMFDLNHHGWPPQGGFNAAIHHEE